MIDRRTNRSRGFGFVRFGPGSRGIGAAGAALGKSDHRLAGKWIEVKRATPQEMSPRDSATADSPGSPEDAVAKAFGMLSLGSEGLDEDGFLLPVAAGAPARGRG